MANEYVENVEADQEDAAPQIVENNDLNTPATDPAPETVEWTEQAQTQPTEQAQRQTQPTEQVQRQTQPAQGVQPAGARRSTRNKTKTRAYTPSMSGSKYSYAVTQLESHGVINPDAHMFVQDDFHQSEPDVEDGSGEMTVSRGKVHKYLGVTWITPCVVK